MTGPTSSNNNTSQPTLQASASDRLLLDEMMDQLTPKEIEVAARASHEYLAHPDPNQTKAYAQLYANRFLQAKDGDAKKALKRLKETLQFRADLDVDSLRTAFQEDGDTTVAKHLEKEMQAKNVYVQGYDKEGRSTYIFVPRNVQDHDDEWTIKQHVYNLERAVACSQSADKTVNAVVDFNGFSLRNAPPTHIGKEFMKTLRNHYAGTIHSIYLIDAPTSFMCLWGIFKPLVGKKTRDKIHFISSKKNSLAKHYEAGQAATFMMRDGLKNRELDISEYLYETPFHQPFDA